MDAARASRFPHIEAIAAELALRNGNVAMRGRAIAAYGAWGAVCKAESL